MRPHSSHALKAGTAVSFSAVLHECLRIASRDEWVTSLRINWVGKHMRTLGAVKFWRKSDCQHLLYCLGFLLRLCNYALLYMVHTKLYIFVHLPVTLCICIHIFIWIFLYLFINLYVYLYICEYLYIDIYIYSYITKYIVYVYICVAYV